MLGPMASHNTTAIPDALRQRSKIPDSWRKAFGILRGHKPDPIQELKKMRRRDEARSKALAKRWER